MSYRLIYSACRETSPRNPASLKTWGSGRNAITTEKAINNIYYKWLTLGTDSLSQADSALVDTTAKTCSIFGGPAVFKARVLYSLWHSSPNWDDISICENIGASYKKDNGSGNSRGAQDEFGSNGWGIDDEEKAEQLRVPIVGEVNVHPNPSKGHFYIKYNFSLESENPIIQVFDLTGKLIYNNTLDKNKNKKEIDLSNYSNGIYTLEVRSTNFNYKTKITLVQ